MILLGQDVIMKEVAAFMLLIVRIGALFAAARHPAARQA